MRITVVSTLCLVLTATTSDAAPAAMRIAHNGQPRAAIVVQPDASEQLAEAVTEMQRLVEMASGAKLAIGTATGEHVAIHVGRTPAVAALAIDLGELDGDGFVIQSPDTRTIVILGPTDWGTEFGVYEFLERYVGVRWLLPGPDGADVPSRVSIEVPVGQVRQEPAIFSRLFSGLSGEWQTKWARRNRMHGRVSFHHYLLHVFPPESYTKTHPDFFPV